MAENYNLNSSFGLNVTKGSASSTESLNSELANSSSGLFEISDTAKTNKYDSVFSGEVEREINMYSRQAMIVGMNLRASDTNRRKFDMNI